MENIKIFDANLNELGIMERREAHLSAQWHKTFHCWIINKDNGKILFQQRSKTKDTYPSCLDVSVAGHLIENEEIENGIREIHEELGIDIPFNKLYPLGSRIEANDFTDGQKNREFQYVFLATIDSNCIFVPKTEEVVALFWISIEDALKLFGKEIKSCQANCVFCNKLLDNRKILNRVVTLDDFVPRIQNYYLTISIMADRVLKCQFPLSIS